MKMPNYCQKCNTEVVWLWHKDTNKPAPIEAAPSENGNIFVKNKLYRMATKDEIEKAKAIGKLLYLNHFATCEFAKSFSKKESAKPKDEKPKCVYCELELNYFEADGTWFCSMGCRQNKSEK